MHPSFSSTDKLVLGNSDELVFSITLQCGWGQRQVKKKTGPIRDNGGAHWSNVIILLPLAAQYTSPLSLLFRSSSHGGVSEIHGFRGNTCSSFRPSHAYPDLFPAEPFSGFVLIYWDLIDLSYLIVFFFCTVTANLNVFVRFGTTLAWVITCPLLFVSLHKSTGFLKRLQQWWRVSNESCLQWLLSPLFWIWVSTQLYTVSIGFPLFKPKASVKDLSGNGLSTRERLIFLFHEYTIFSCCTLSYLLCVFLYSTMMQKSNVQSNSNLLGPPALS